MTNKYIASIYDKKTKRWIPLRIADIWFYITQVCGRSHSIGWWIISGMETGHIDRINGSLKFESYSEARAMTKSVRRRHPEWTHFKIVKEK